jgi:hypothetical protein
LDASVWTSDHAAYADNTALNTVTRKEKRLAWFDYFATFNESMSVLSDLCTRGMKVIPEPHLFDEPKARVFETVTKELTDMLEASPGFYLAGPFTIFPVQFLQLREGAGAGKFMIDSMTMGPLLIGELSRITSINGEEQILPGRISHHRTYRNPETDKWEKASRDVIAGFKLCVRTIQQRCVHYEQRPGVLIVIGRDALDLLKSGEVRIDEAQIIPAASA